MLPDAGFVDTLQRFGPRIYSTDTSKSVANQFAAMPSLHFGWAFIVAGAYVSIRRTRRSLWAMLHPAITLLAIVATANHYWLDAAVAGVLVVAAAALLSVRRERQLEVAALPTIAVARPIVDAGHPEQLGELARLERPAAGHRAERRLVRRTGSGRGFDARPPASPDDRRLLLVPHAG